MLAWNSQFHPHLNGRTLNSATAEFPASRPAPPGVALRRRGVAALAVLALHASLALLLLQPHVVRVTAPETEVMVQILSPPRPLDAPVALPLPPLAAHLVIQAPPITIDIPAPDIQPPVTKGVASPSASPIQEITGPGTARAVTLSGELAVYCPDRRPPAYPVESRLLHEHGEVLLRVELDETGHVGRVTIERSSGSPRLDEAGRRTVLNWRCQPPLREGKPVRAVALQPIDFVPRSR